MEGISDIKIIGIDAKRPPRIRKEPYIELFFELSHQAPADWCEDFNRLVAKWEYSSKITPSEGRFIDAWVRKPEEIEKLLASFKKAVSSCTEAYITRIEASARAAAANTNALSKDEGEQGRLNRIVAALNFDD